MKIKKWMLNLLCFVWGLTVCGFVNHLPTWLFVFLVLAFPIALAWFTRHMED